MYHHYIKGEKNPKTSLQRQNLIPHCRTDTYFTDLNTGGQNSRWLLDHIKDWLSVCL